MITLERVRSNATSANCGRRTSGSIVQPGCAIEVNAEGSVQAGGGEANDRAGEGTVGDYLLKGYKSQFARTAGILFEPVVA